MTAAEELNALLEPLFARCPEVRPTNEEQTWMWHKVLRFHKGEYGEAYYWNAIDTDGSPMPLPGFPVGVKIASALSELAILHWLAEQGRLPMLREYRGLIVNIHDDRHCGTPFVGPTRLNAAVAAMIAVLDARDAGEKA